MPGSVLGAKDTKRRDDVSLKNISAGAEDGSWQAQQGLGWTFANHRGEGVWEKGDRQTGEAVETRAPPVPQVCTEGPLCQGHSARSLEQTGPCPQGKDWRSVTGIRNLHKQL